MRVVFVSNSQQIDSDLSSVASFFSLSLSIRCLCSSDRGVALVDASGVAALALLALDCAVNRSLRGAAGWAKRVKAMGRTVDCKWEVWSPKQWPR